MKRSTLTSLAMHVALASMGASTGRSMALAPEPQALPDTPRGPLVPLIASGDFRALEQRIEGIQGKQITGVILDELTPRRPLTGKAQRAAEKRERRQQREASPAQRAIQHLHEAQRRIKRAQSLVPFGGFDWHQLEGVDDSIHLALTALGD